MKRNLFCASYCWFTALIMIGLHVQAAESPAQRPPVKIIFDTDIGNDVDDVIALSMLHALESRGACQLLGVTITLPDEMGAPFINAVNTFYNRPEIPIGCIHAGMTNRPGSYLQLADKRDGGQIRYPHRIQSSSDAPEAVTLLRKLLAGEPDHSVVIVQVGYFSNLAALLDSVGDDSSPLSGPELIKQKVRFISIMAGCFQTVRNNNHITEFNVIKDIKSAQKVARDWPTPIVWSGFSVGWAVRFPAISIEKDFSYVTHHPAVEAYYIYNPPPHERPMWDPTSVLYAVFPDRGYFGLSSAGRVTVEDEGFTRFTPDKNGRDRFLTLTETQAARAREAIVQLAIQPPK